MKTRTLGILAALVGLLSVARADSILLSDNFSGSSLDATKWTTLLPQGSSSVTQSGGAVNLSSRGGIATVAEFSTPYIISGAFTLLDHWEHFNVSFRTDLSTPGAPFHERAGMLVSFSNDGDQISIQRYTAPDDMEFLTVKSFALATGVTYFFSIFDDGYNVALSVNGVSQISAASSYSTGGHIAFASREFWSTATSLDAVTITRVPEIGATIAMLGAALVGLASIRRLRTV